MTLVFAEIVRRSPTVCSTLTRTACLSKPVLSMIPPSAFHVPETK
jgi:hypothetical protein